MQKFSSIVAHIITSLIFVLRNFGYLVYAPYKTMRRISKNEDKGQIAIIFIIAIGYFIYAQIVRQRTLHPLVVSSYAIISITGFFVTFYLVTKFFHEIYKKISDVEYMSIVSTFAYSLLPTFIWFFATSTLFYILPPPRTESFLGKGFSMTFVVFSTTLLFWRVVLLYLSLRFSTKQKFYRIAAGIGVFMLWFLPYSYLMYKLQIFRIPFI